MSVQKVIHAAGFNEVCEAMNKVYDVQWIDWDLCVPAVLWAYRKTCKKLMDQMPLRLEYGVNVVIPIEYKIPILCLATSVDMMAREVLEERIVQLNKAQHLGPKEEIWQGDLRLQELMKERVRLREKSTLVEAKVKKQEDEIKKIFSIRKPGW